MEINLQDSTAKTDNPKIKISIMNRKNWGKINTNKEKSVGSKQQEAPFKNLKSPTFPKKAT